MRRGESNAGSTVVHIVQEFLNQRFEFNFNVITNRLLFKEKGTVGSVFRYMTDIEFNTMLSEIKKSGVSCSKETLRMILFSDFVKVFNPFVDYMSHLPEWDGMDYIQELADTVVTHDRDFWNLCLRKWIVALVGALIDDEVENQTAIIFSGSQGIGKTKWFHSIIPIELREFIFSGCVNTNDKETQVKISECILILMDELENLSPKKIDAIKQLMTQKSIYMRRAYTTMLQSYVRRASFAGTVNHKQFLYDLTGNRRFLCFEVTCINYNHNVNLQMLFAQALHLFRNGFQFWFNEEEINLLEVKNYEFRAITPEEEVLFAYFQPCEHGETTHFMTTTQIQNYLIQKSSSRNISTATLGHVLRAFKFIRLKRDGVYGYLLKERSISTEDVAT